MATASVASAFPARRLKWDDVQKHRFVSFEEPQWDGNELRIPIRAQVKRENIQPFAPRKLDFDGSVTGNVVRLKARFDRKPGEQDEVVIKFPSKPTEALQVVYEDPDKTHTPLMTIPAPE